MSSNDSYSQESKNLKLTSALYKISQEPTKMIEIKHNKKDRKSNSGFKYVVFSDAQIVEMRRMSEIERKPLEYIFNYFKPKSIDWLRKVLQYENRPYAK